MDARLPRRFVPGERVSRRVVLALDALDGPVAVKLAEGPDPGASRELAREFERLAGIAHPAFPRAGSFGFLADGRAWMSMERASGEVPAGPMTWSAIGALADDACEALAAVHAAGLLHRDVKPDHLRFDESSGRVMLLDLGSASPPGRPFRRVGTPGYVAPEIVAGRAADARSDLYGLGVVLHELATGRPAHAGEPAEKLAAQRDGRREDLAHLRPDAPPEFLALIAALLSPDPEGRPGSADECRRLVARARGLACGPVAGNPPLLGREREMDALLEMAERARHQPLAVTLAGPAGSGRSLLLESFRVRMLLQGSPVAHPPAGHEFSLAALARTLALIIDAPVGAAPGAPLDEIRSALEGACRATQADDALQAPVVILVDSADEMEPRRRAELAALAGALPEGVLLVVADGARGHALGQDVAARVDLGPLAESTVRSVLHALLREAPAADLVARALASSRQPGAILAAARTAEAPAPAIECDEDPLALLRQGRIAAAVSAWQARLLALPDEFEGERARTLARLGHALWVMAEPADALARAEAALALAAQCGDPVAEAEAACVLGRIYGSFGSTRDGVGWERRALELASEHEEVPRDEALAELGSLMIREGHVEAAMRALTEAVREAESRADASGAALARARLGRARMVGGDLGGAERLLRRAVAEATAAGDCLAVIEAQRHLGDAIGGCGENEEALRLLEGALARAVECGVLQELPALHEALARVHLRRAVRLRTSTGAIVDRRCLEVARAHVEKGLDLALATGRMADRAALAVLSARCALLVSDARGAQGMAEEAHLLALAAGDLLVASQARLVKAEALLDLREFGVALAEARIGCEAFERSGDLEDSWRAHALLARIHGAWGMAGKQAEETAAACRLLRRLEASLKDERSRRCYLADVDRASALAPPLTLDAPKARRGLTPELEGSRFAGRADTEDLVEALIASRQRIGELERRVRRSRSLAHDALLRRDALLHACTLASAPLVRARELSRVLELLSRACGGARVVAATSAGGRLRVRGVAGTRRAGDAAAHEASLVVAREVVETGRGSLALGARGHRRADPAPGEAHVALPLEAGHGTFGALVVRPAEGRELRRADVRLLRAAASLLSRAILPAEDREEVGAS